MTDAAKKLSAAARALSAEDRLKLVEDLLESLDVPDEAIDRLWAQEAQDRLAAYRRGEIEASGLSEILAKYRTS
jgi:putative addiction module component (TIGR02574 family)